METPIRDTQLRALYASCLTLVLFISGCASNIEPISSSPSWFLSLPTQNGRVVGYGKGDSYQSAKHEALADLAEQREALVNSEIALLRKSNPDDSTSTSSVRTIQVQSEKRLTGAKTLQQEELNGLYYIALQLDLRPTPQIIADALKKSLNITSDTRIDWQGSPYLTQGALIQDIHARLNLSESASVLQTIHVSLDRNNDGWFISLNDIVHPLDELDNLLNWKIHTQQGYGLTLKASAEPRIKSGSAFQLQIKQPTEERYLSLFNLYSDGRLSVALDNQPSDQTRLFPDDAAGIELAATPLIPNTLDRDLYLALWSAAPLDTTPFIQTQSVIAERDTAFQLHRLLAWLEEQSLIAMQPLYIEIHP